MLPSHIVSLTAITSLVQVQWMPLQAIMSCLKNVKEKRTTLTHFLIYCYHTNGIQRQYKSVIHTYTRVKLLEQDSNLCQVLYKHSHTCIYSIDNSYLLKAEASCGI